MKNNYSLKINNFYSNTSKINLFWLRLLLIFLVIIEISLNIAFFTYNPEQKINWFHIIASFFGLMILFMISIFSIIQPEILNRRGFLKIEKEQSDVSYRKFRMGEAKEKKYARMITQLMEKEKPYLNETVNLKSTADMIGLTTHQLSMILNLHFKQNFYSYVNKYRIDEAKSLLRNPEYSDYNVLHIAYKVGFNSKSVFNSMFKKFTGTTPTEYRKSSML